MRHEAAGRVPFRECGWGWHHHSRPAIRHSPHLSNRGAEAERGHRPRTRRSRQPSPHLTVHHHWHLSRCRHHTGRRPWRGQRIGQRRLGEHRLPTEIGRNRRRCRGEPRRWRPVHLVETDQVGPIGTSHVGSWRSGKHADGGGRGTRAGAWRVWRRRRRRLWKLAGLAHDLVSGGRVRVVQQRVCGSIQRRVLHQSLCNLGGVKAHLDELSHVGVARRQPRCGLSLLNHVLAEGGARQLASSPKRGL
mmetsp:Transcript_10963/g.36370  ORF Transcript_10963/g.36370 Transcript_10963/m.36370 type:complete len:247 (-) Transcript_10963:454-1194(-)